MSTLRSIAVYCASSPGRRPIYLEAAHALGTLLARERIKLVWGGGNVGLMGAVADAVLAAGGETIGVIPGFLVEKELAHATSTEMHIVSTMHTRKALMADRSDAFIAMPGGFGTADELFEILTWGQLELHHKPIGLLNVDGYFDGLILWIRRATDEGLLRAAHADMLCVAEEPEALLGLLRERALGDPG